MAIYYLGYSIGTVLFGWFAAIVALWIGRLLKLANPWWAPLLTCSCMLALIIPRGTSQAHIVALGTLPAWFGALGGVLRHRSRQNQETEV